MGILAALPASALGWRAGLARAAVQKWPPRPFRVRDWPIWCDAQIHGGDAPSAPGATSRIKIILIAMKPASAFEFIILALKIFMKNCMAHPLLQ
jgi:hypothetical protein